MTDKQRIKLRREMGWLGYAFLWLLGRPLVEHDMPQAGPMFGFYLPVSYWKVEISHNIWVHIRYAPNVFHRCMQRLAFGVRWYCVI